jgi:hypothetical protein
VLFEHSTDDAKGSAEPVDPLRTAWIQFRTPQISPSVQTRGVDENAVCGRDNHSAGLPADVRKFLAVFHPSPIAGSFDAPSRPAFSALIGPGRFWERKA